MPKKIFITGAASGIGKATAELFAARGWQVGLCDVNLSALNRLADRLGDRAMSLPADVLDVHAMEAAIEQFAGSDNGKIDLLFNSAGILDMRTWLETPLDRQRAIFDINVIGVLNCIHAAFPKLCDNPGARIVTMSSTAAVYGVPSMVAYSASKFAVRAMTEGLNIEFKPYGIWVCDIMVGFVDTPMVRNAAHKAASVEEMGVNVEPDQVAETVWRATEEEKVHHFVDVAATSFMAHLEGLPCDDRGAFIASSMGFD